jgi:hypothetical protein
MVAILGSRRRCLHVFALDLYMDVMLYGCYVVYRFHACYEYCDV